jgi:DNA-binding transcriptional MerR regulator
MRARSPHDGRAEPEYTIQELARLTGLTPRNIRAHQSRGLIPPPEVRGRVGYYGSEHRARVELVRELQDQGFNLAAIRRILGVLPSGVSVRALDFERALLVWHTEEPEVIDHAELVRRFPQGTAGTLEESQRLGLLVALPDGRYRVPSPGLLRAAQELVELGVPIPAALDVQATLVRHARGVAKAFAAVFLDQVWRPFDARGRPEQEWPRISEALDRMRLLAEHALVATFRMAMDREARTAFDRTLRRRPDR